MVSRAKRQMSKRQRLLADKLLAQLAKLKLVIHDPNFSQQRLEELTIDLKKYHGYLGCDRQQQHQLHRSS